MPLSWGGLVISSLSGDLIVIAPNGQKVGERRPDAASLNTMAAAADPTRLFMASADARVMAFMQPTSGGRWDIVNTNGFAVSKDKSPPSGLNNWNASDAGLTVTDWIARPGVKLNGRPLTLFPDEWSRAVDVRPGRVLIGASWSLRPFDGAGKQLWQQVAPGTTWRVNQSEDGRIAVAAFGDGTVRWYRMSDGKELLALFLPRDAQRWVAFTPSGYYAASPGGEDLIGWQVNRGPGQTTNNDFTLVFMAGHGVEDEAGSTFFLPEDGDPERLISTGVAQADLQSILARSIAGKVVAFLDICHAGGAVLSQGRRGLPDQTKMVNELAQAGDGLMVFAAARASEVAVELPQEGHGAFTEALLEGLERKADPMHAGSVRTDELNGFLADRVRDLTGGRQHPVMLRPRDIADFPMVAVLKN